MSHITKARSAALGGVCRVVVAARRQGRTSVDILELEQLLDGVDVEALANPRPCPINNVGRPLGVVVAAQA